MNGHQLEKIGLRKAYHRDAFIGIQSAVKAGEFRGKTAIKDRVRQVLADPKLFVGDAHFNNLATALIEDAEYVSPEPCKYKVWGSQIDAACHRQMEEACRVPVITAAALLPDGHVAYSIPVGGVVACENAVMPYAVGVDIACRVKMSVLDLPVEMLESRSSLFEEAIEKGSCFGVGSEHGRPKYHPVMDKDWTITRITREVKDKAHRQLGTSGSGNHFLDVGILSIPSVSSDGILPPGSYVAVLTHSGSRGAGYAVCSAYTAIAKQMLKPRHEEFKNTLAWLDMNTQEGQEYFAAMNLMGDYAAANHDIIHDDVSRLLGAKILTQVENHHNFCWYETIGDKKLYVHRKGATPAGIDPISGLGVPGIIPGSMASPAFLVRGKGNPDSLMSASHGAGRLYSRTQARQRWTWKAVQQDLAKKGIKVLSAGADEVPYVYKDIVEVIKEQQDLVEVIGRFDPRIVKMSDDGQAED